MKKQVPMMQVSLNELKYLYLSDFQKINRNERKNLILTKWKDDCNLIQSSIEECTLSNYFLQHRNQFKHHLKLQQKNNKQEKKEKILLNQKYGFEIGEHQLFGKKQQTNKRFDPHSSEQYDYNSSLVNEIKKQIPFMNLGIPYTKLNINQLFRNDWDTKSPFPIFKYFKYQNKLTKTHPKNNYQYLQLLFSFMQYTIGSINMSFLHQTIFMLFKQRQRMFHNSEKDVHLILEKYCDFTINSLVIFNLFQKSSQLKSQGLNDRKYFRAVIVEEYVREQQQIQIGKFVYQQENEIPQIQGQQYLQQIPLDNDMNVQSFQVKLVLNGSYYQVDGL